MSIHTENKKIKGLLEAHSAVLLFGLAGLFGKLVNLPAMIIVLGRVFFSSIFLLILIYIMKDNIKLKNLKEYFLMFTLGIILAIHWCTFYQAIIMSNVALGLVSFSTFAVFVTFIEPIVFKYKLRSFNIIIAILTFLGITLIVPSFQISNRYTSGVIFGIISGFTFAILSILNKKFVNSYSSVVISFYEQFSALIILLPFLVFYKPILSSKNIMLLAILGVVFTGISHALYIKSLKSLKTHTVSIISNLEPVYGIIFSMILLKEIPNTKELIGAAMVLSTSVFVSVKR